MSPEVFEALAAQRRQSCELTIEGISSKQSAVVSPQPPETPHPAANDSLTHPPEPPPAKHVT